MNENWFALLIATEVPCKNVEEAFQAYDSGRLNNICQRQISLNMLKMRQEGCTAQEIATKYNTQKQNVFNRISTAKRSYVALE